MVKLKPATSKASCWREANGMYGERALGPYVVSQDKESGQWSVWWQDGTAAWCETEAEAMEEMRALFAKWSAVKDRKVYFIGTECKVGGIVKIGIAFDPKKRLASLQTSWPHDLKILGQHVGDVKVEQGYHRKFAKARLRGEWFRITPALKRLIEQHA
jgi:hypothetical protein